MNKNADNDFRHQLWLIYSQLKDAESDPHKRLELLEHSREELGKVLNDMNKQTNFLLISVNHELKSTSSKAANSNCRNRQFNLTPDRRAINVGSVSRNCLNNTPQNFWRRLTNLPINEN